MKMNNIFNITFRKYLICTYLCILANNGFAQQLPVFNQYIFNPELFNPAALGDGFVGIQYQSQFSELDSKIAPRSFSVTADLSTLLNLSEKKIAIGINIYSDKVHILNRVKGKFLFAYHLIKNKNNIFSAGIEAGIFSQNINFSETRLNNPEDLTLYNSESNKMTFDGGFGISYKNSSQSGNEFNFNFSLPQLFTSDLEYNNGRTFITDPHLIASASYKFSFGVTAIEPHILYRSILGYESNKKGFTYLSLRAHFFDSRFWIGGGSNLKVPRYNLSFGVQVIDQLHLQGSYETHSILGNTYEILLRYTFEKTQNASNANTKQLPELKESELGNFTAQFKHMQMKSVQSAAEVDNLLPKALEKLNQAESFVNQAKENNANQENVSSNLNQAKHSLEASKLFLEEALVSVFSNSKNEARAKDLYIQALEQTETNNKISNSLLKIKESAKGTSMSFNKIVRSYDILLKEIKILESKTGIQEDDIGSLTKRKDAAKLTKYYQEEIESTIGVSDIVSVKVDAYANYLKLKYQYPNSTNNYNLDDNLDESKLIADHVIRIINELESKMVTVESISVSASMQARKSTLASTKLKNYYRENQFGLEVNINYMFFDSANNTMVSEFINVRNGEQINLLQLACLKMYGIEKYLNKKGISSQQYPISFELVAPNYDQSTPQEYSIIIQFK